MPRSKANMAEESVASDAAKESPQATPAQPQSAADSSLDDATVRITMRPAEEAPTYHEWKAEQDRKEDERRREFERMREKAAADVERLIERFQEHGFADAQEMRIIQTRSLLPLSSELLLMALIEEGRLDRLEMQARQLVIQAMLLNTEFQRRCTERTRQELAGGPGAAGNRTSNGGHTSGLVLPESAKRGKTIITAD